MESEIKYICEECLGIGDDGDQTCEECGGEGYIAEDPDCFEEL